MLTELQVKNAKPRSVSYMVCDDKGLYLRVAPSGRKYWILRYWENGKEHKLSLGTYLDLPLKETRLKRDEIQTDRAKGKSPALKSANIPQTFSEAANEWLRIRMKDKALGHLKTIHDRLNKYILPVLGAFPLREITSGNILHIIMRLSVTSVQPVHSLGTHGREAGFTNMEILYTETTPDGEHLGLPPKTI